MAGIGSLAILNELSTITTGRETVSFRPAQALLKKSSSAPGGSFRSLRDTLAHLVAAEWRWLERWRGQSPRSLFSAAEFPTLAAVRERRCAIGRGMRGYLSGLGEEALSRPITCGSTRGRAWI
jgi:uncharacterized damage-inducible protein DinB